MRLNLHKYKLLFSAGKLKDYVKAGCGLLTFLFRDLYNHPQVKGRFYDFFYAHSYYFCAVLVKLKIKKKKIFRSIFLAESRREDMEMEHLLSPLEWFNLYRETCMGLLKLGTATSHYKITYFIYCAALTMKFSGELEKVSFSIVYVKYNFYFSAAFHIFFCVTELHYKGSRH